MDLTNIIINIVAKLCEWLIWTVIFMMIYVITYKVYYAMHPELIIWTHNYLITDNLLARYNVTCLPCANVIP